MTIHVSTSPLLKVYEENEILVSVGLYHHKYHSLSAYSCFFTGLCSDDFRPCALSACGVDSDS